jgi:ABC-type lipoprotein export system ATPase subunit
MLELHREENTILITVTHSLELAARFPQRAELTDGKLVFASKQAA